MDKLEIMENQKKESQLSDNVNGRLFNKLEEIWKKTEKEIFLLKDWNNNYLNEFEYDWKEISAWVKIHGREVGDFGWWEFEYFVSLYDLAKCTDLSKAVTLVEEEKWIIFSTNDTISLDDSFDLLWVKKKINPILMIVDRWLKDIIKIEEILNNIVKDLKQILTPNYDVWISNMSYNIILEAKNQSAKQDIINLSPEFLNKIKQVQAYFENNLSMIYEKIDDSISVQKQNAEDIYRINLQRIESLRKKI